VVPYFPRAPHPQLLVIGEAPGPLGANRTGFPFWGDHSGLDLYGLIESLGLLDAPLERWKRGADLSGTQPPPGRYAITNACPQMPLLPDGGFCAPEPARLEQESARLADEVKALAPRAVLACGKAAAFTLARASARLGDAPPAPLAGTLPQLKLTEAMTELGDPRHAWTVGGAQAFVTCHPSRGQWLPQTPTGKLHAAIVARLREALR
jgi:uracil-DNA glycosylase